MMFADIAEVQRAYDNKEVELATRITVRLPDYVKDPISGETVKKVNYAVRARKIASNNYIFTH